MATTLPHNKKVQQHVASYVTELRGEFQRLLGTVEGSPEFRNIFRVCWGCDVVFAGLSSRERPKLAAARSIVRRLPVLVGAGQLDAARWDLRRLIELVFWAVYFTNHPVEWQAFSTNPVDGYAVRSDQPISFCAHRERSYYANYAIELFDGEPSGIAREAAQRLNHLASQLNAFVHAGREVNQKQIGVACDRLTNAEFASYRRLHHDVCAPSCVVLAAILRPRFDRLSANEREWFDWLVGSPTNKKIRSGEFGLQDYK